MMETEFLSGEIVLYKGNDTWAQFIKSTDDSITLYDGFKNFECDTDEIEKAQLPLALDGLGFKFLPNSKRQKERYVKGNHIVSLVNGDFYIKEKKVTTTVDIQVAFNLFHLITFKMLERRMKPKAQLAKFSCQLT
ncbi:MAG TPA: hypothetical protein VNI52_13085 [Sphingobacteriaceae bacterium]|nr:hypothetical protein [Sphingobacteriaceae bacterium]